jgi:DNA-binding cell septation regulator SpoVG
MATDSHSDAASEAGDKTEYLYYLREAEIAKFADFAGISIDEAIHVRVEQAVAEALNNFEITARPIEPQGNLYGFASVKIGGMTVDDFKIVADKDGKLFVGMPSKADKGSRTGYRNTVHIDKDFREDFGKAVLGAHYDAVEALAERAEKLRAGQQTPPRIAEQAEKAAKEAAAHNAALPPKEKKGKARAERE